MKRIASGMLKVCLWLAIVSLFLFVIVGGIEVGLSSDGIVRDTRLLAICGLLFILAIAIGLCGSVLDAWVDHRATKAARIDRLPRPMIPLRFIAKPEGYNLAVLRWFHRGPELREGTGVHGRLCSPGNSARTNKKAKE